VATSKKFQSPSCFRPQQSDLPTIIIIWFTHVVIEDDLTGFPRLLEERSLGNLEFLSKIQIGKK